MKQQPATEAKRRPANGQRGDEGFNVQRQPSAAPSAKSSRPTSALPRTHTKAGADDAQRLARRKELAAESKMIQEAGARAIALRNAEMRRRLKSIKARPDGRKGQPRSQSAGPTRPTDEFERARIANKTAADNTASCEEQEVEMLREMLRRSRVAKKQPGDWDATPHRAVPYTLRGLRPLHTIEPWSKSVLDSCKRLELRACSSYATSGLHRLDDGMNDDFVNLRRRQMFERSLRDSSSSAGPRPEWDSTPWLYTPPALRGLKPVTPEPWSRDIEIYNQGTAGHME